MTKNHFKTNILILVFSVFTTTLHAQDSINVNTAFDILLASRHNPIGLGSIDDCINCASELTDNPNNHFGVYGQLNLKLSLNSKYNFKAGLLAEERGFSFGNFTQNNLKVIPYINFNTVDTFNIGGADLKHVLTGGDMWEEDINDIIRFFNLDFQGVDTKIGLGNYWFRFLVISDLSRSVGLRIGEIHRFSFEYRRPNILSSISVSNNIQIPSPISNDQTLSGYFRKSSSKSTIEGQLDYRLNNSFGNDLASSLSLNLRFGDYNLKNTVRYYGSTYNRGFKNTSVNYLGNQLYPLKNYFRNLTQWAFFTNFQNTSVLNYELLFENAFRIAPKIQIRTKLDLNLVYLIDRDDFDIYPAYDVMIDWYYLNSLKFEIGLTNKHMELFSYYQSSTLSKIPFLTYGFTLDLQDINKRLIRIAD